MIPYAGLISKVHTSNGIKLVVQAHIFYIMVNFT